MSLDHTSDFGQPAAARPFASLLDITEGAFVDAGNNLEMSVRDLQSLRGVFTAFEANLGSQADSALKAQVADVSGRIVRLRQDFAQFGQHTRSLRDGMAKIRSEVRALNTVVSLFANISINARIQGNSLMPPRPQINSFIARLGALSDEADTVLREVNDAMLSASDAVTEIEGAQAALSDELRLNTFPAIETFAMVAQGISDEQIPLHDASIVIAGKMQAISSEVATLITSLQIGDTLRQRLEQAHASLALSGGGSNERSLSFLLAPALAEAAIADATPYIDDALSALQAVADRGQDIKRSATSSAFGSAQSREVGSGLGAAAAFEQSLSATRAHFSTMQSSAQKARAQVEVILGHDGTLQRIAQHLRMAGINAVIACARLGEEGRALRELAQWLRAMTDESDGTMHRLQAALATSRATIATVSDELVARSEADLSDFVTAASELGSSIGRTNDALLRTSGQFDVVAGDLASRLSLAMSAVGLVRSKMVESQPAIRSLQLLAKCFPAPDPASETAQAYLAALRRKYTMASERTVHDQLVASLHGNSPEAAMAAGSVTQPTPAQPVAPSSAQFADVDDLTDILF